MKLYNRLRSSAIAGLFALNGLFTPLNAESDLSWAHETSDLSADPNVTWGKLENGFRYAMMPNTEPPDRVSLRLYVKAGSLMEKDDQRGLAHFLEHMAFNGTRHFPAGELVEYFQRLGMSFGADTNAYTSYDRTVYMLELPRNDQAMLEEGLQLLRDYADGILLKEEEIDKERGVILSEKRSRDSVEYRTYKSELKFVLPESLAAKRFPIGEDEVIEASDRDQFLNYYQKWYCPDRMVLIAVGSIDPEILIPLIEKHFTAFEQEKTSPTEPDLGEITETGVVTLLHSEPEAAATTVSIQTVSASAQQLDSRAKRAGKHYRNIADQMITRRLEILAKEENSPFSEGVSYSYEWLNWVYSSGIELTCQPNQWQAALATAEIELRRALTFGFTQSELDEAKAKVIKNYEQMAKTAVTRKSRTLARELVQRISKNEVFTSPGDERSLVKSILADITPDLCHRALKKDWASGKRKIFISGNLRLDNPEPTILGVFNESLKVPVEPPEEVEDKAFAYTQFGPPGKIISRGYNDDVDITQIAYENNLKLNIKPTDFEKNTIYVGVRIGGGGLTIPDNKPGLSFLADSTFIAGGLVEHSADELERIFSDKTVDLNFSVGTDAFVFTGKTTPEDLISQLQLLTAYIIAPGYREEALRSAHKDFDQLYVKLKHTPQGVMQNEVSRFIASGDERFGYPDKKSVLTYELNEVRSWLTDTLKSGPIEVSIVGDLKIEETIEGISATLGSLPERRATKPDYKLEREVHFAQVSDAQIFPFQSNIPKAVSAVYWPTDDMWKISQTRRLNVLSLVFDDRMRVKIREETGQAYSPYSVSRPSDTYKQFGYFLGLVMTTPEEVATIANIILEIGNDLQDRGINEDELERAIEPLLTSLRVQMRSNRYWLNTVLLSSQEFPQKLDWARSITEDYKSITVEDINLLANKFLKEEKALRILVTAEELSDSESGSD